MMAGTRPPDLSNAISTMTPFQKNGTKHCCKNKKPAGLAAPAG
jgi:hypothetical protein